MLSGEPFIADLFVFLLGKLYSVMISVICPVYGAEKTLSRCIDSVLAQTFKDFEFILVDDGSKDSSGSICDEYAARDQRIIVIHKENGGISSARQAGMDIARGDFFIHVDSDDWVDPDWLERLFETAISSSADVVIGNIMMVDSGRMTKCEQSLPSYSQKKIAKAIVTGRLLPALWNKLIRRSVYDDHSIRFPVNVDAGEDIYVCHSLFIKGVKCAFCSYSDTYYYYDRFGAKTISMEEEMRNRIAHNMRCVEQLEKVIGDEKLKRKSLLMVKGLVKMKAFYLYDRRDFLNVYKEINLDYVVNNFYKITKVEGYVALGIVIRNNTLALSLFRFLKSLFGRK